MNKVLNLVCRQANFKKIVSIGFFAAFFAVFLSAGTAQASFLDWFNLNKKSNDFQQQQAAAVANTKATSTAPTIKVVSPNGGEVWKAGTKKNITFKGNLRAIIDLHLEWSGGNLYIGESVTPDKGKISNYSWTIPATLEERNDYKIRIDYKGGQNSDSSDKTFTIKSASGSSSSKSSSSRSSKSSSSRSSSSSATSNVTLNVQKQGKGAIKSDDGKINCGSDCKEVYYSGGSVALTAVPMKGFAFDEWTGNACLDKGYEYKDVTIGHCTVSLEGKSKALTAKAHFKKTFGPWE